ncbi:hypothetical protein NPIL_614901 [Nephila pilipes]|uniref:Uncharacterized protein n=1 Tax=Nephila pilipes TaxID=299642 RepID=A0A8X6PBR2_NEPPI|nr:hypothetical protein NPIL_614901 [Nephila pilipes]
MANLLHLGHAMNEELNSPKHLEPNVTCQQAGPAREPVPAQETLLIQFSSRNNKADSSIKPTDLKDSHLRSTTWAQKGLHGSDPRQVVSSMGLILNAGSGADNANLE